ncbi:hypothetical protein E2P81_ATG10395, partial [Venturia nashicola]
MADDLKGKVATVEYLEDGAERQLSQKVDIQHNNPLSGLSKAELRDQVVAFCSKYGFEDRLETFHKASMVAQRPQDFESIDELSEDDKHWLRREITNKWDLPWAMYTCITIVSIGSAIQGWDNTGANGANLSFPQEFDIAHRHWLVGIINAAPVLCGIGSAFAADPVNQLLGRRGTIFATNLFVVFPVLAQGF